MNVRQVTKIVSACLILAACHDKPQVDPNAVGSTSKPGIGVETKAGKLLTQGRWCRPLKTDATGVMRSEQFVFRRDGSFKHGLHVLNTNATMTKESEDKGTWAVYDGQLILMRENGTLRMNYADYTRTADNAACLKLTAEDDAVAGEIPLCPCGN